MTAALDAIENGCSLKKAERDFGVPRKTLRRHRDGKVYRRRYKELSLIPQIQTAGVRKRKAESAELLISSPFKKTAGRQSSFEAKEDPKEEDAESPKDEESKQEQDCDF